MNYLIQYLKAADTKTVVAQIIGFAALGVAIFVFLSKKRKGIIAAKFITDALFCIHFALLGQYTGACVNLIALGRGAVFYNKDKKWASHILWCFLFVILTLLCSVFTWQGIISLLPTVGSSFAVIGMWSSNTKALRLMNLFGITLWLIYSIIVISPSAIICNILYITTILYSLLRDASKREKSS